MSNFLVIFRMFLGGGEDKLVIVGFIFLFRFRVGFVELREVVSFKLVFDEYCIRVCYVRKRVFFERY